MKLIDGDALKKAISNHPLIDFTDDDLFKLIDNAPTVKDLSLEIAQKSIELGRKVGQLEGKLERPQGDLISREYLKKRINERCNYRQAGSNGLQRKAVCNEVFVLIDNAPTVTERPQGEWKTNLTTGDIFCSCCKEVWRDTRIKHINFCPNCGAKMKGGTE